MDNTSIETAIEVVDILDYLIKLCIQSNDNPYESPAK
jgi:hypothetical protein